MKKVICIVLFCLGIIPCSRSQESEIRATIDKMFQSMYKRDTSALKSCFTRDANLWSYAFDLKGNPIANQGTLDAFLKAVASMGELNLEERLTGWQCLADDGIASVWTPYEFYVEEKFSHCGVNSFQLIKVEGAWKISQITDTRRKINCVTDQKSIGEIDALINLWHHAAAIADEESFFSRMTPDGIYIGTDASERWLRDELKEWSKKYFDGDSAWDFKPLSRNTTIAPGGQTAWFDELLDTWMGTCRSTGILSLRDGEWKIVHYQLSIAVPNDKLDGFLLLLDKK